ncbi:MAG: FKBP-type peptidyl-prolyl cis-trans isomerase [Bacteroidales bacterium]
MTSESLSIKLLAVSILAIFVFSCRQEHKEVKPASGSNELKESMTRANQRLASLENEKIRSFIDRYGWDMKQTGTGLFYSIYKQSNGLNPVLGDTVVLNYSSMLLNGEELYSSEAIGPLIFELGKSKTINGLEEGIFLMRLGERAKFIIPSHLAFGLLGDQEKIPQRATLVYDVELTSIKKRQ